MRPSQSQVIAATRFGLGPSASDYAAMGTDPKAWLKSQIANDASSLLPGPFPTPEDFFEVVWAGGKPQSMAQFNYAVDLPYEHDLVARCTNAMETTQPFRERMVRFWSNHFSVSPRDGSRGIIGAFEREVVRPRVMGRFEDLLLASSSHPLMICYLENNMSRGPNSQIGSSQRSGLNENLAREIMELHTLGVDGGYGQKDIIELAKAITGWTFNEKGDGHRPYFAFRFEPAAHEPGPVEILGKVYRPAGVERGRQALRDLARHPSTAAFIGENLAKHFHSDDPPQKLVDRLARAFEDSSGDLSHVCAVLIGSPELWTTDRNKVKSADDYWVSILRAGAPTRLPDWRMNWAYHAMHQPVWSAPSPAGWPDDNFAWGAPGHVRQRMYASLSVVFEYIDQIPGSITDFGAHLLGPYFRAETKAQIEALPERSEQLLVLLMSPEFQRR